MACPGFRTEALFHVRSHRTRDGVNSGDESVKARQVRYRGLGPKEFSRHFPQHFQPSVSLIIRGVAMDS